MNFNCAHKSKKFLHYFFISSLIISLLLATYQPIIEWLGGIGFLDTIHAETNFSHLNYQMGDAPQLINTTFTNQDQKTTINLHFNPLKIGNSETILETAPTPQGIRISLQHRLMPPENPLVKYISIKNNISFGNILSVESGMKNNQPPLAVEVDDDLSLNTWHHLKLIAWNKHFITIFLDGVNITRIDNTAIDYSISQIKIGGEANNPFQGNVTQSSIKNASFDIEHHRFIKRIKNVLLIVSSFVCLLAFLGLSQQPLQRQTKINYIALGTLLGLGAAIVFHYIAAFYFALPYPHNTFLCYDLGNQFKDFYDLIRINTHLDPYFTQFLYTASYPPFIFTLTYPLTLVSLHLALVLYFLIFLVIYIFLLQHYLVDPEKTSATKLKNYLVILIIGFMSYPLLFSIERGNTELFVFLSLALFIFFYEKKQLSKSLPFLIIAISMKFYPAVFLALFFSKKHYKVIGMVLLAVIMVELLSFALFKHSIRESIQQFITAISHISLLCENKSCVQYNVGLWGSVKTITENFIYFKNLPIDNFKLFTLTSFIFLGLLACYVVFIEKILWKKVTILSFAMLLIPIMSNDYKLLHVYLPLFLFLTAKEAKYDLFYATFFIMLLIPKNYYTFLTDNVGINSLINPGLMLMMVAIIAFQGMHRQLAHYKTSYRSRISYKKNLH